MKKLLEALVCAVALASTSYATSAVAVVAAKSPPATLSSLKSVLKPSLVAKNGAFWGVLDFETFGATNYMMTVIAGVYVSIPVRTGLCSLNIDEFSSPWVPCVDAERGRNIYYELPNCGGTAFMDPLNDIPFKLGTALGIRANEIPGTSSTQFLYSNSNTVYEINYASSQGADNYGSYCDNPNPPVNRMLAVKVSGKAVFPTTTFFIKRLP